MSAHVGRGLKTGVGREAWRSGGRTGLYRRTSRYVVGYRCVECGLEFIAGRTYARTQHDRPYVADRAMHWDDDLELESLITGARIEIRSCATHPGAPQAWLECRTSWSDWWASA